MDVYQDVLGLMKLKENRQFQEWHPSSERAPIEPPRLPEAPPAVRKRELARQKTVKARKRQADPPPPDKQLVRSEVAGVENVRSFSSCPVPLNVIVNRETYADGHQEVWMVLDTKPFTSTSGPAARREEYAIRTEIEEAHRQYKCFWDLAGFTSRSFSLVLNQVLFVLLAFNLLQLYLRDQPRREMTRRSRPRVFDQLVPTVAVVIIYSQSRFAVLAPREYSELILTLSDDERPKVLARIRKLKSEMVNELQRARPP